MLILLPSALGPLIAAMSGLDSTHAFESRAAEIGMSEEFIEKLKSGGVKTFGSLAFSSDANPQSNTEEKFRDAIKALIGEDIEASDMIPLRRLWFEAHALVLSDIRSRTERTEADQPRKMPLAERLARISKQKSELKGLVIDSSMEPAHALVDKFQNMVEEGCLIYVGPEKCLSREEEVTKDRKESSVAIDSAGGLKLTKKAVELQCDVSGELRLRAAFTRRALAMHQTNLVTFDIIEEWRQQLFTALIRHPPAGHKYVTTQQVLTADKQLWLLMSQDTRGKMTSGVGDPLPLDAALQSLMKSPEVLCYMTPLPAARSEPYSRPEQSSHMGNGKGKNKGKGKGSGSKGNQSNSNSNMPTIKELLANLPEGCQSKLPNGKWLCCFFNKGICKHQKKASCHLGLHQCYYRGCTEKRPYIECKH